MSRYDILELMQPELLTVEQLVEHLKSRCIPASIELDKSQLVEIFRRVCMPLPQRQYKQNRRGKMLTEIRKQRNLERKTTRKVFDSELKKPFESKTPSTPSTSGIHVPTKDRLKPPPCEVINKKIKLGAFEKLCKVENGSSLDHIVIKQRMPMNQKLSNCVFPKEDDKGLTKSVPVNSNAPRIKLKRPAIVEEDSSPPEEVSQPKKERKRISWP